MVRGRSRYFGILLATGITASRHNRNRPNYQLVHAARMTACDSGLQVDSLYYIMLNEDLLQSSQLSIIARPAELIFPTWY